MSDILKSNKVKTYPVPLTKWIDKTLPVEVDPITAVSTTLGPNHYQSRHPLRLQRGRRKYENQCLTVNVVPEDQFSIEKYFERAIRKNM